MANTLSCPDCGETVDSAEALEEGHEVPEVEASDDGSLNLYDNRDLFLCRNCRTTLGVSRS